MKQIISNLFVGSTVDCRKSGEQWAIIHACKHPCHYNRIGWTFKGYRYSQALVERHPEYVAFREENDLFLNMIDADSPNYFPLLLFSATLRFITEQRPYRQVLVHCNEGLSRSPSLILLYLAKKEKLISNESYNAAQIEFIEQYYPIYSPGRGIYLFLKNNWKQIGLF